VILTALERAADHKCRSVRVWWRFRISLFFNVFIPVNKNYYTLVHKSSLQHHRPTRLRVLSICGVTASWRTKLAASFLKAHLPHRPGLLIPLLQLTHRTWGPAVNLARFRRPSERIKRLRARGSLETLVARQTESIERLVTVCSRFAPHDPS